LREVILALFGSYTPLIDPVSGSAVLGVAGLDWPWIAGVFLFGLTLYCILRILGGAVK